MIINDQVFRAELDAILKQRKMLKKSRSEFISISLLSSPELWDGMLDDEIRITGEYIEAQRKAKKMPTEHQEQAKFYHWFTHTYPDVLIFAIPNGGMRSGREAASLVMEGVTAGVADLFVDDWNCYIEFKRIKGGVWGVNQQKFADKVRKTGKTYLLVKGSDDAKRQVLLFLNK